MTHSTLQISSLVPQWPAPSNVKALSTLRGGGVSVDGYASLNLAGHVGDEPAAVRHNRIQLVEQLGLPGEPKWLNQVHGTHIVSTESGAHCPEADGCFASLPGDVCVVLTADCLPVLLCGTLERSVAAVHVGWRGLLAGVLENAVARFGGQPLLAWLGPAIGPRAFEVGDDVRMAFSQKESEFLAAFRPGSKRKWHADIYAIATSILQRSGNVRVYGGGYCTYADDRRFYSFRREQQTGRMASMIWFE